MFPVLVLLHSSPKNWHFQSSSLHIHFFNSAHECGTNQICMCWICIFDLCYFNHPKKYHGEKETVPAWLWSPWSQMLMRSFFWWLQLQSSLYLNVFRSQPARLQTHICASHISFFARMLRNLWLNQHRFKANYWQWWRAACDIFHLIEVSWGLII